jgi:predicted lipid-binding transport protein (Tim44 family)
MGDQVIDIILFAGVAFFLVFRLWSVLGRRTGTERPPLVPPTALRQVTPPTNVVPLADRPNSGFRPQTATSPLQVGINDIQSSDPNFRPEGFIDGARHAFEIIVKAYAEGDTATLRPLVGDEVYDTFSEAIRHRLAAKETVDTHVVRLQEPELVDARLEGRTALVTIKFVSGQVSVTRDAEGKILEGDPERPAEHIDHWTFSRNTRSSDPNWILVGTGTPE